MEPVDKTEFKVDDVKLKRLRNLKMFRGKSDDEIIEFLANRAPKPEIPISPLVIPDTDEAYARKFRIKLKSLQSEYGIDMNDSNDAESLKTLVRVIIQQELTNEYINKLQKLPNPDTRELKNIGDFQRNLIISMSELQDKLGISRKTRKEKDIDDIGKFIETLRVKAKDLWQRETVSVSCGNCEIEMARYWLNFPKLTETVHFEIECWKCHEKIIYTK